MSSTADAKRAYLKRDKRRATLLDAAARLVEKKGWDALTMVSLAREARISRQLVYQHFASVDELMAETLRHLFEDVYERTRDAVMSDQPHGFAQTVQLMQRITMEIPAGRARALWQAMSGGGDDKIGVLSRRLRHLLVKTSSPGLERSMGITAAQAGPLTWMLIVAFWGARQIMEDDALDPDATMQLHGWMVERVLHATSEPPPKLGSKGQAKDDVVGKL